MEFWWLILDVEHASVALSVKDLSVWFWVQTLNIHFRHTFHSSGLPAPKTIQGCQTWWQFSHSTGIFWCHVSIFPIALGTPWTRDTSSFIFVALYRFGMFFNQHEILSQWAATLEVSVGALPLPPPFPTSIRLLWFWWSRPLLWQLNQLPHFSEEPGQRQQSWLLPPGNWTYIDCFLVWHSLGFSQSILYWPLFCFLKQKVSVGRCGNDGEGGGKLSLPLVCLDILYYFDFR